MSTRSLLLCLKCANTERFTRDYVTRTAVCLACGYRFDAITGEARPLPRETATAPQHHAAVSPASHNTPSTAGYSQPAAAFPAAMPQPMSREQWHAMHITSQQHTDDCLRRQLARLT
jgi:hypothetical protein